MSHRSWVRSPLGVEPSGVVDEGNASLKGKLSLWLPHQLTIQHQRDGMAFFERHRCGCVWPESAPMVHCDANVVGLHHRAGMDL